MKRGIVVRAHSCTGKSHLGLNEKYKGKVLDLKSAPYRYLLSGKEQQQSLESLKGSTQRQINPDYPSNYFKAIKDAIKKFDFVLVSQWSR